jgi:2-methylcitrate dehydratase PrpD
MVDALGTAGSQSAGLMSAQYSSMTKRFHAGRAAQSGLYAATLARRGYVGIAELFEAEYGGYGTTFSPSFDPGALVAGLGSTWETLAVGFKAYSTNGSCHPTIDALLDLRESAGLDGRDVESIRLRVSTATKEHVGWDYEPDTVTTAQMNLPYICAVVLTDGDAFVRQFSAERIVDPTLVELSRRVSVEVDPAIDAEGDAGRHHTRIEVVTRGGQTYTDERRFGRGSAARPLTDDELLAKFAKLTEDSVSVDRRTQLLESIEGLDSAPETASLLALIED